MNTLQVKLEKTNARISSLKGMKCRKLLVKLILLSLKIEKEIEMSQSQPQYLLAAETSYCELFTLVRTEVEVELTSDDYSEVWEFLTVEGEKCPYGGTVYQTTGGTILVPHSKYEYQSYLKKSGKTPETAEEKMIGENADQILADWNQQIASRFQGAKKTGNEKSQTYTDVHRGTDARAGQTYTWTETWYEYINSEGETHYFKRIQTFDEFKLNWPSWSQEQSRLKAIAAQGAQWAIEDAQIKSLWREAMSSIGCEVNQYHGVVGHKRLQVFIFRGEIRLEGSNALWQKKELLPTISKAAFIAAFHEMVIFMENAEAKAEAERQEKETQARIEAQYEEQKRLIEERIARRDRLEAEKKKQQSAKKVIPTPKRLLPEYYEGKTFEYNGETLTAKSVYQGRPSDKYKWRIITITQSGEKKIIVI